MKDRVPTAVLENGAVRMEQFDASGNSLGYVYLRRADAPSEDGTPYSKNAVLTDATADALGLTAANNPTPNDAFAKIAQKFIQTSDAIANLVKARPAYGSYIGNGEQYEENKITLQFDFKPLFVVATYQDQRNGDHQYLIAVRGATKIYTTGSSTNVAEIRWTENSISWWSDNKTYGIDQMLNRKGETYVWFAIGIQEEDA